MADTLVLQPETETNEGDTGHAAQPATIGSGDYVVQQGDCVASIAFEAGLFWKTIWNLPANARLKAVRKDPYLLLAGDRITIPPIQPKAVTRGTDQLHKFVRKGVPEKFRLRLLDQKDKPRARVKYVIVIEGTSITGVTGSDGMIEVPIPPNAREGKLVLVETEEEFPIFLGHLDPVESVSGVQARLNSLGFMCGAVDGEFGPHTESAIRSFQAKWGLDSTGTVDGPTKAKILEQYGC